MRVKRLPQRTSKMINTKQVDGDVTGDSTKGGTTSWENLSHCQRSFEINQQEYIGTWDVLDLTLAGPSSHCYQCWSEPEVCLPLDYTAATLSLNEPIDLSIKPWSKVPVKSSSTTPPARQSNEFKDTFLYKMLTDPTFAENLKGPKKSVIYTCPFCKKQFPDEDSLMLHQKPVANDTNKIACCACNKTFTQKRYLRYHQRSHSDRNKFTCDICYKKYSRQDNLTRHNTFHTNPDKFLCNYCNRTFSRKDLLNKHVKGHENRFSYHCEICDKYFKGPLSLQNHQRHYHKEEESTEKEVNY